MINKITFLCTLIVGVGFLAGCKKGDSGGQPSSIYLVSGIKQVTNGVITDTVSYKYDNNNRIIESDDITNNTSSKYSYDSNDHVIEIDAYYSNSVLSAKSLYSYSPGIVTLQLTNYYITGGISHNGTYTLTLNSAGRVTKSEIPFSGTTTGYYTYSYDNSGNVITQIEYINSTISPTYTYNFTYDNKKSDFFDVKGNFYISRVLAPGSPNNVVMENAVDNTTNASYISSYTYTFNSDGYPTIENATPTPNGGTPFTGYRTYIKR